jgi:hypothetical protein
MVDGSNATEKSERCVLYGGAREHLKLGEVIEIGQVGSSTMKLKKYFYSEKGVREPGIRVLMNSVSGFDRRSSIWKSEVVLKEHRIPIRNFDLAPKKLPIYCFQRNTNLMSFLEGCS